MTKERLARLAGSGDDAAFRRLAEQMQPLIYSTTRRFYAPGLDRNDVHQAAMVGLWNACRDYDLEAGSSFASFAVMCIRRSVITAVKTATRGKHRIHTDALRLDRPLGEDAADDVGKTFHDVVASREATMFERLEQRDRVRAIVAAIRTELTPLERESLVGFAFNGESYGEIEGRIAAFDGDRPGRAAGPVKVVDNALVRARLKLRRVVGVDRLPFRSARMTAGAHERESQAVKTAAEMQAEHEAWRDAQPVTTRCAFCLWTFEGTVLEAREAARQHRIVEHPEAARAKRRRRLPRDARLVLTVVAPRAVLLSPRCSSTERRLA